MSDGVSFNPNVSLTATQKEDLKTTNFTEAEIKLFDFDGDGVINSDRELSAYATYKEQRDEAKLEQKFDVNGDKQIDTAEKAAFNAYKAKNAEMKNWENIGKNMFSSFIKDYCKTKTDTCKKVETNPTPQADKDPMNVDPGDDATNIATDIPSLNVSFEDALGCKEHADVAKSDPMNTDPGADFSSIDPDMPRIE